MSNLALFDLDNTLILQDSDVAWSEYFATIHPEMKDFYLAKRLDYYNDYKNDCLDVDDYLNFQLATLKMHSKKELDKMHAEFMQKYIVPYIFEEAKELVKYHKSHNDDIVLISSTNKFIITPIAKLFGIVNIIGVDLEIDDQGNYTGNYIGTPSYRDGKVIRLFEWLDEQHKNFKDYQKSFFYSDSITDLPLLELVSNPVVVNPDEKLKKRAIERHWEIRIFSDTDKKK